MFRDHLALCFNAENYMFECHASSLPCFGRVAFNALGSVLGLRACVHAFRLSHFHLMATDVSVADVHS